MNTQYPYLYIGSDTLNELRDFCKKQNLDRFILVTDQIIYPIWGESVQRTLVDLGVEVQTVILEGNPVSPDERYLINILVNTDSQPSTFLAVGSGTITDMVRFIAHRTKRNFISLPTAPSMDGYAASGSALTLNGMKQSVTCAPPLAILADLPTLAQAPHALIEAGFGDVFGKFTALADWALGGLIINDRYIPEIALRVSTRLEECCLLIEHLESAWEKNIFGLTDALLDVGLCMLEMGNSRPASGSEHSCSHYWEMKLMSEGRPVSFHGTKVGLACALIAERYEWIKNMPLSEVKERLSSTPMSAVSDEIKTIHKIYGPIAEGVMRTQKTYLEMTAEGYHSVQQRIITHWDEIQNIAASVPSAEQIRHYLQKVGLPTHPEEIGLTSEDVSEALNYGHYLRDPYTIIKLLRMLGFDLVNGV